MNYLHIIVTFIIVLFIYVHVQFQLTTSDEKDVYILDGIINIPMEEVFDLKQPVVMNTFLPSEIDICRNINKYTIGDNGVKDINIYDNQRTNIHTCVSSSITSAIKLFDADEKSQYYSENNNEYIANTEQIFQDIQKHLSFLIPPLKSSERKDILFGSNGSTTSLQYSINYRNFFTITNGTLQIKMVHPETIKASGINIKSDYFNLGFFSDENVWNNSKIATIDTTLYAGQTICIPPYWLYSFKFTNETFVWSTAYNTYMTDMATIHHKILQLMHRFTKPTVIPPQKNTNDDSSDISESKPTIDNECDTNDSVNQTSDKIELNDDKNDINDEVKEEKDTLIDSDTSNEIS